MTGLGIIIGALILAEAIKEAAKIMKDKGDKE